MLAQYLAIASVAASALAAPAVAAPAVSPTPTKLTTQDQINSAIAGLASDAAAGQNIGQVFASILESIVVPTSPDSIPYAISKIASASAAHPTDFFAYGASLVFAGVSPGDISTIGNAYLVESNTNNNNPPPPTVIYPKKSANDAPYDLSEQELRSKLYIPPTFTYGKKLPIILIPGTGGYAGQQLGPNYGKLLASQYDVTYLNIPGNSLIDIQNAAEYVAYAINYLSSISNRTVATIGWSQSSVSVRWAAKYWPSTRSSVYIAHQLSADYHGSVLEPLLCPPYPNLGCAPAILQQNYNSTFIATLRNHGGDSTYGTLNSAYSTFDEIVEPQQGTNASAYSNDARGVGVSNIWVQQYCGIALPGGFADHESMMFHALAYAAAVQSLQTGKNADLSLIDVASECLKFAPAGLDLADILATEATIPLAGFNVLTYPNKVMSEPPIKAYAQRDIPAGYPGYTGGQ